MRLVLISDTHMKHDQVVLPEGDVLVHAGDLLSAGTLAELTCAASWLQDQRSRFENIVVIGGNHDFVLEAFMRENSENLLRERFFPGVHYLRDSEVTIKGIKFYGSPWQPEFFDWAFNLPRGHQLAKQWAMIPTDTDVLVTHGPPSGVRDWVGKNAVGCGDLRVAVDKIRPQVHVFGHIHEGYGLTKTAWPMSNTTFVNASVVNSRYQVVNKPLVVEV